MGLKVVIAVMAVFALSVAMVPLERRSLPEEEEAERISGIAVCDRETPCLWAVYIRFTRVPDYNISNHCVCKNGTDCLYFDDDISISAYVYRCLPLSFS